MNFIFSSPSLDDLIRLLTAWRFWVISALIGSLIGVAVFFIVPPPYRAQATVNVDFNLEEALPSDSDRQHFYYLERESRKMVEIAWSDEVLNQLQGFSLNELRDVKLNLAQPAESGWRFYADDADAKIAEALASAWANSFVEKIESEIEVGNINQFVKVEVTQQESLPKERSVPLSSYLLVGSFGFLLLAVFLVLFVRPYKLDAEKR